MSQRSNGDDETLSLEQLAHQFNVQDAISMRKQRLSERLAGDILSLFKISVISTVLITIVLALVDTGLIVGGVIEPDERLVNERVLLAIIGATLVELGAAIGALVWSMFAKTKDSEPSLEPE